MTRLRTSEQVSSNRDARVAELENLLHAAEMREKDAVQGADKKIQALQEQLYEKDRVRMPPRRHFIHRRPPHRQCTIAWPSPWPSAQSIALDAASSVRHSVFLLTQLCPQYLHRRLRRKTSS